MARKTKPRATPVLNPRKFDNVHQQGGIRLATVAPDFGGGTELGCRVAQVNTGSGLRFDVALDRGGDIIDAFYQQHSLAYLSPVGLRAPAHAHNRDAEWLANWPAGLVTTCGPRSIGHPRHEDGQDLSLHGHQSNLPANLEMLLNPDPLRNRREMLLSLVIRDARMFGPILETRRQIQCILGEPVIQIFDQVTNRGDLPCPHHWLYHVNFGYPLLDEWTRLIYRGKASYWQMPQPQPMPKITAAMLHRLKAVPAPLEEHRGGGERGVIVEAQPGRDGLAHIGIVNPRLKLAVELVFPVETLPRFANWQHYSSGGAYVTGLEPFSGSLMGKADDSHPAASQTLQPGQTIRYELTIRVHSDPAGIRALMRHDGKVVPA